MSNAAQELRAQIIMAVARAKNPSGNSAEKSAYFHAAHAYTHALEMLYADEGYEVQDGIAPTVGMRAENYLGWVRNFLSAEVFSDLGFEKRVLTGVPSPIVCSVCSRIDCPLHREGDHS